MTDDPDFLRQMVETVIQEILETEMTEHIGAPSYERSAGRKGHRNGYKPRLLRTRVGTLNLLVPQDREGNFSTSLFARYQRSEKALLLSLMEMYLKGVSTRKVTKVTETLCGTSFSKSQVSALTSRLESELAAWRERPLTHKYPGIIVDARYEDVRVNGSIVSQGVLIVKGVRGDDGKREILAIAVADTESEATWQEVFAASDRESAIRIATAAAERWRPRYPKVAALIEDHIEECLAVLAFPATHRQRLRTTNGLERLNEEIKRRARVIRIFPNRESCLRLVTALAAEQSDEWVSGNRYLNMEELVDSEDESATTTCDLVAVN